MKVINKTNYDTRYLRSLFIKCEKHEGTNHKYRQVKVIYHKTYWVGGYAWYNSHSVVMKLPHDKCLTKSVAQTYLHEVGHNLGLHHKEMPSSGSIDVSWLPNETVPFKKLRPPKPKQSIIEVRTKHAQKKLEEWNKKLVRAKTFVRKYQRKVKYYEKKMVASPVIRRKDG